MGAHQTTLTKADRKGEDGGQKTGRLDAILYVLKTGIPWNDLPEEYGDDSTANRRLRRWERGRRVEERESWTL